MSSFFKRNKILCAIMAIVVCLTVALACGAIQSNVKADAATPTISDGTEIKLAHITDTHYYPFRLSYTGAARSTMDDNYFYNYIQLKSTKMQLEAEAIFDKACLNIKQSGVDYVVLSGDVGQDGELLSHIDVANKLREVQNYMRSPQGGNIPNFQVFVVMGNHDVYNPDTFRFDNATGMKETDYYTTRMDAIQIYAGLGYPNMTEEEAAVYYGGLTATDIPTGYEYVRSDLSKDFSYRWEFIKKNGGEYPTYNMATENADDVTVAKLLQAGAVDTIDNSSFFRNSHMSYRYETANGYGTDIEIGTMTFIAARNDGKFSALGLDVVLSNADTEHVLGGQLQDHTQSWLTENRSFARTNGDKTLIVGLSHHSLIPHWDMEEQITTGFIVYNWQEVSDFLADYGMRYIYTGHMHANDTVSRVSFNGNQLIDMETSSNVSVGSMVKVTKVVTGTYSGKTAETATIKAVYNDTLKASEDPVVGQMFDKVFKNDKYGYVANNKLESFVDVANKTINNYSKYSETRIYRNAVVNKLKEFLRPAITQKISGILNGMSDINIGPLKIVPSKYADDAVTLADNLIKQIGVVILKDYKYTGTTEGFNEPEMKAFGYLEDLVNRLCYHELADGVTVFGMVMDMYANHNLGEDKASVSDYSANVQKAFLSLKNGTFVEDLFSMLLDREQGLYRIIEGLSTTSLDLSAGLKGSELESLLNSVGKLLSVNIDLAKFNLGEIIKGAAPIIDPMLDKAGMSLDLAHNTIPEAIDSLVEKYLTESFKQGLGEYAYIVIKAFGVDGGHQDVLSSTPIELRIKEYADEPFTYMSKTREEVITVDNGKLPSMITVNFGSDPSKSMNFTYFTDRRVTDGAIEYTLKTGDTKPTGGTVKSAETEIYGTTKPLIDLGIWCQCGYTEYSRNTIELTNLKADSTYWYRLGSPDNDYWSEWHTFTTAPAEKTGAFEVLIGSDLQSSTESAYQRIAKLLSDVPSVFPNGIDFMINPGDVTDNGRNISQYTWWLNSSDFYANTPTVVAAGNHDAKYFQVNKAGNYDEYSPSANAVSDEYNYLWMHFNYNLTSEQKQTTGFYYSFDYSGVHFTVLNTNDITNSKLSNAQYTWLVNDLQKSTQAVKVVVMHKSLYSAGSHSYDADVIGMRAQLTPVFADNGVSLVIAGHDHTYTETYYLDANGNKVLTDANGKNVIGDKGTLYLTMGTMGDKFYKYVSNDAVDVNTGWPLHKTDYLSDPTFGKLVFDGEKLYYYGYQYLRTMENGVVTSGKIVEIKKSNDYAALASIILMGITVIAGVATIIATCVKYGKKKK